ncbi:MAG: FMN-binding protein [Clostridia bacterium]|nr:FMN-binding protein [Clostridia bacterium]
MKKKRVIFFSVLIFIIVAIIAGIVLKSHFETNLEKLKDLAIKDVNLTSLKDGIYTGGYKVFPVAAEVKVSIKNHNIAKIELVKHDHGQGSPAEAVTGKVVEAQTLDVDIVSGATYSSKVILKAIENALKSASK